MEPISLHAYDAQGKHISALPYSDLSWKDSISDAGSMSCTIPCTPMTASLDMTRILREYGTIWLAKTGDRVLHAGWMTDWKLDDDQQSVSVDIGGGWTIWEKRLVLNHALASSWKDGTILIDDENPPGDWVLTLTGTLRDIARGLLEESIKWGSLPYALPKVQGGSSNTRTYQCWDMATVSDRLGDIADLEDGPEIRFDPQLEDFGMSFTLNVGSPEIVDHEWKWNTLIPGQRVMLTGIDASGDLIATESYGVGGKNDDNVLVARTSSANLTGQGWPVLQMGNTSHSSVGVLATLQSYVASDVTSGDEPQLTVGLSCGIEHDVHVGDHIDLRIHPNGMTAGILRRVTGVTVETNSAILPLKVTDVSGSADKEWLELQTRIRGQ